MKTNSLKYNTTRTDKNGTYYIIKIRLNDECKNGHQDFSITATYWEKGVKRTDRNASGGACGDKVAKSFPEFDIFNRLHLCDYLGTPMHAIDNGFYFLQSGFSNTPIDNPNFKTEFCKHYRVTPEQFDVLNASKNKFQFAIHLMELEIPKQWKKEADEAIKLLEELTGDEFVVDSPKTLLNPPSEEQINEEKQRIESGYYSAENEKIRANKAVDEFIKKLDTELIEKIKKETREIEIKKEIFLIGGKDLYSNVIYYNHTNSLGFNWKGYGKQYTIEQCNKFYNQLNKKFKLDGFKIGNN